MNDFEATARANHKSGKNCATAVYEAFGSVNPNKTTPPKPRSEGGKCGAVLAAEQVIREMGGTEEQVDEFEREFAAKYGSLKCAELRGILRNKCNDYVGTAAGMVGSFK